MYKVLCSRLALWNVDEDSFISQLKDKQTISNFGISLSLSLGYYNGK
jgi:hypothetical protein